ncbi:DNA repair-scaffolding protein [Trichinella pseudospiralis]
MSVDGSPHRVPVFKRVFLSSLSKEIGSKWPTGKQEEKLDDSEHVSQISQIDISWTPPDLHKKRMLFSGSRRKWRYNFISHTKQSEESQPKATTSMRQTVFGHSKDENECPSKTACLMSSVCNLEIFSSKDSPVKIVGRCDLQSPCRGKKPMKANTLRRIQLRRTNSAKKLFQDFGSGGECGYCSEFFNKQDPTNDGKPAFECQINLHSNVEFNEYGESNDDMILISEWSDGVSQESIAIQTSSQTSESCSVTVEATDHHLNSCSSNPTSSSPVEFCHFAINNKRFNGRRRFIQGGFAEQFQKSIKRQMSNLNIWHHRRRNDNAFSKDNHAWFNKKEHENIQYELIAIHMEYGYYKCICQVARTSLKILIIFHRYVFESYSLKCDA